MSLFLCGVLDLDRFLFSLSTRRGGKGPPPGGFSPGGGGGGGGGASYSRSLMREHT